MKKIIFLMLIIFIAGCIHSKPTDSSPNMPPSNSLPQSPTQNSSYNLSLPTTNHSENRSELPDSTSQISDNFSPPKPGITWQWQLNGRINTDYDVDLYDVDLEETPKEVIDLLHGKGIIVICYFNAGAYEPYRNDSDKFPAEALGKTMTLWEDEKWLDISNYKKFSDIMLSRLDMAVKKGCDGVEPDNIESYKEDTGFHITYKDQLEYNKWLAKEAHKRNLLIALKNDGEQARDLVDYFDFAIVEECFQYNECDLYSGFIKHNKAVLEVEYKLKPEEFCEKAMKMNFSSMKMDKELDGERIPC